ncbi:MAG: hypothetical protein DI585_06060 [Pseudomonas fluorescens]|nr:MAG: hypothetical protein DI585_06060 [Pseudomonas fluorescens]
MSKSPAYILGLSAFSGDSAAALLKDGTIVAAAQEERFSRVRHDARFPHQAAAWCLTQAGITLDDITYVVFYDKPLLKFARMLETFKALAPQGMSSFIATTTNWLNEKFFQKQLLTRELIRLAQTQGSSFKNTQLLFANHHLSHAASAFYPSPFERAVVLVVDGIGEWATTTVAIGTPDKLEIVREISFPHSLGLLYSAFTSYVGYKPHGDEYKLMGLAAFGTPIYAPLIREHLVHVKPDGSFRLNMDYFDYMASNDLTNSRFHKLFGAPPLKRGTEPTQREMDIAASIQQVMEEIVLRMTRSLAKEFSDIPNLCLAGEVAYNRIANSKVVADKENFQHVWIQPAADDSGGAIGAALCGWHQHMGQPMPSKAGNGKGNATNTATAKDYMSGAFLGPSYTSRQVEKIFDKIGAIYRPIKTEDEVLERTADALAAGKVVGWFQGRMEFGNRALGARSLLADPRNPETHKNMGTKTRGKQELRPCAASISAEDVHDWFETTATSPYMLLVARIRKNLLKKMTPRQKEFEASDKLNIVRSAVPAVTHIDDTARIHTVHAETNSRFHALLKEFKHLTGCPMLANAALSTNSQPIVNTPEEAFRLFMSTDLDVLVIEDNILYKEEQNPALFPTYKTHLTRR